MPSNEQDNGPSRCGYTLAEPIVVPASPMDTGPDHAYTSGHYSSLGPFALPDRHEQGARPPSGDAAPKRDSDSQLNSDAHVSTDPLSDSDAHSRTHSDRFARVYANACPLPRKDSHPHDIAHRH